MKKTALTIVIASALIATSTCAIAVETDTTLESLQLPIYDVPSFIINVG